MLWAWPWHYTCTTAKELFCAKCVIHDATSCDNKTNTHFCVTMTGFWQCGSEKTLPSSGQTWNFIITLYKFTLQIVIVALWWQLSTAAILVLAGLWSTPTMAEYVVKKMDINTFLYTIWILYFLESRAGHTGHM